jgi:hypothetical protein
MRMQHRGGAIPQFLALLVRFRGKTVAARDRRGDIGIPLLLEHRALPLGGEKPSKMAIWQMQRPWARRTVALEAGQRILSHLVSHPDLLTTVAALFYYPPWRGPSPCALEALRGPSGGASMTSPDGLRTDRTGAAPFAKGPRPDVFSGKFVRRVAPGFKARYRYTRNKRGRS